MHLNMQHTKILFLAFCCLLFTDCSKKYKTEEVTYQNKEINISARIHSPTSNGKFPAIVQVPSAEPDTKDTYIDYAEYFSEHGIVTLSYDKRGSGKSSGNIEKASFTDLLDDALAGVKYLKNLSYVDTNKIGFLGHSQGGMYIFMSESITDDVAFLINISGSPGSPLAQSDYNIQSKMLEYGASQSYADSLTALMHDYIIYLRERNNFESIKSRHDIAIAHPEKNIADKINYFKQFNYLNPPQSLPPYEELEIYPFMRSYDYEAAKYFSTLKTPSLIIYGRKDYVIPAEKCYEKVKTLIIANPLIEVKIYDDANHGLKEKTTFGMEYPEGYFEGLTKWILEK